MTQPSSGTTTAPPGGRSTRSFLVTGVLAIVLVALASQFGFLDWLPAVGDLLERGGTVSAIAILAVTVSLWIVLFAAVRMLLAARERAVLNLVRLRLSAARGNVSVARLLSETQSPATANSLIARRLELIAQLDGLDRDGASSRLAGHSELDHARGDVSYLPARALVWSLPALGFLGTAAEMSRAIGALGGSVGATTSYANLRDALVSNVIPPLADAFGVTLFALAAGVVCHLLLTWANARDQRLLLDTEEVTMQLFAKLPVGTPAAHSLNGEVSELIEQLGMTRSAMKESARQVASLDLRQLAHLQHVAQLAPLLQAVNERLDQIRAELRRDLVITRVGEPELHR
jgi:hypothetical protein